MINRVVSKAKDAAAWTDGGLWRIRLAEEPFAKAAALRWLRILVLSGREFTRDNCSLRASALTFYSMLSIVPLAALAFGIAQGFGVEKMLENLIRDRLAGQEEVSALIIEFSRNQLVQTRGGVVAGVGVLLLFWTVLRVLSSIERSFNAIWGVGAERRLARKFSDYLAFVLIGPIVLVVASSMTVYIVTAVEAWAPDDGVAGTVSAPVLWFARLLPGTLIWALFTFMYVFMPNNRVAFPSALLGGVVAGTGFQITQALYVNFQIGVAQYGAIYGSFAALPLFLVWMQLSWVIVLYGAELAYAHENVDRYEFRPDSEDMSPAFRRLLALAMVRLCVQRYQEGAGPPASEDFSRDLGAPGNAVNSLLAALVDAGVLAEANTGTARAPGYLPALPPEQLDLGAVIGRLEALGAPDIPLSDSAELESLRAALDDYWQGAAASAANRPLHEV